VACSAQLEVHVELHPKLFCNGLINGFQFFGFIFNGTKQAGNPSMAKSRYVFFPILVAQNLHFSEELVFPDFYPIWAKGTLPTKSRFQKSPLMLYLSGSRLLIYTGRRSYPWHRFYPAHISLLAKWAQTDVKADKPFQRKHPIKPIL